MKKYTINFIVKFTIITTTMAAIESIAIVNIKFAIIVVEGD